MKPIHPDEIPALQGKYIPDEVIEIFNNQIVKNYTSGYAKVKQEDVVLAIREALNVDVEEVFQKKWLNIETLFSENWIVLYYKFSDESFNPHWTFTKK